MLLRLAAAALAGSRLRVSNVLFVVVKRYYVSSWICSRSRGTEDSASSSKPPLCSHVFILTGTMPLKKHLNILSSQLVKSSQVELYCHSATCGDIQWNEMSCLTGPLCYINTDIQQ